LTGCRMKGKIIKGIGGFYYVHDGHSRIFECRAKGIFRNQNRRPLVGDDVEFCALEGEEGTGSITALLARRNELLRPAVANVDQVLMISAAASPEPSTDLLDRFLITLEERNVPAILCFNKMDLVSGETEQTLKEYYQGSGYRLLFFSVAREEGLGEIRALLNGKTSVLAGPSGVGKSSLINYLLPQANMETGSISTKLGRGKNTTRHSELFCLEEGTFIMDTPGFTALSVDTVPADRLADYFPEFAAAEGGCRFPDCRHMDEPDCAVKQLVETGKISRGRYQHYRVLFEECKAKRKY